MYLECQDCLYSSSDRDDLIRLIYISIAILADKLLSGVLVHQSAVR